MTGAEGPGDRTGPAVEPGARLGMGVFPDALLLPGADRDPAIARYNRWVLDPESDDRSEVRAGLGRYRPLVDVVAYTIGLIDEAPTAPDDAPADLRAIVASAQAAALVERGELASAATLLAAAADDVRDVSPELAGSMWAHAGSLLRRDGQAGSAEVALRTALDLLELVAVDRSRVARAEIHHELGSLAHERLVAAGQSPREAMTHYHAGLQLVSERSAPLVWAALQLDLAAAALAVSMPRATDQLRIGIAAQSLRAARRVFDPVAQPAQWSSATLNLANALVYLPSTHQGDNLVEAVELYEEVLASGVRDDDPAGRARLLANQGNVLAHLGIFDHARAKLVEARFLFESLLDHDAAMTVRSVLDEMARAATGYDPQEAERDLARQAAQMARMPADMTGAGQSAGMGVRIIPPEAQKRARATVISAGTEDP